jgi:hypothetical protein
MANEQNQDPTTGKETDISKAQAQQQPPTQANQQAETSEQADDQAATGQAQPDASPDEGLQGETATQKRADIEGGSLGKETTGEAESGFVGAQGKQDTSSELVEDDDEDFAKDGQGAPEDK